MELVVPSRLSSTLAGRQWAQVRVVAAGWASHNKCLACLQSIVEKEEMGWQRRSRIEVLEVEGKESKRMVVAT